MLSLALAAPIALLLAGAGPGVLEARGPGLELAAGGGEMASPLVVAPPATEAAPAASSESETGLALPTRLPASMAEAAATMTGPTLLAALEGEGPAVAPTPRPRVRAIEYSEGYRVRAKIHRYASFATLPLFVGQFAVGQKLYNRAAPTGTFGEHEGSDGTRSLHGALAAGTGVLFGINTLTGGWNLYEGRQNPTHRKKRMIHGLLMIAADAGFVATGMLAPDDDGREGVSRSTHRAIAVSSMGVAAVSYLIMLVGR